MRLEGRATKAEIGIASGLSDGGRCEGVEEEERRAAHAPVEVKSCRFCLSFFWFGFFSPPQCCLVSVWS